MRSAQSRALIGGLADARRVSLRSRPRGLAAAPDAGAARVAGLAARHAVECVLGNSWMEVRTVKQCPPFVDAMSHGFVIPLPCDIHVRDGVLSWDWDHPALSIDMVHGFAGVGKA